MLDFLQEKENTQAVKDKTSDTRSDDSKATGGSGSDSKQRIEKHDNQDEEKEEGCYLVVTIVQSKIAFSLFLYIKV